MRIVAGILVLLVGVSYPVAIMFWLNQRMSRPPGLLPRQVGWILAFNGVFPVTLILLGLGLIVNRLGAAFAFKVVLLFAAAASLILLAGVWRVMVAGQRSGEGNKGRES